MLLVKNHDTSGGARLATGCFVSSRVSIVAVNGNNLTDTLECVRSCLAMQGPGFEITIVDNDSSDGSWDAFATVFAYEPRASLLAGGAHCLRRGPQASRGQRAGLRDFLLGRKRRADA